MTSHLDDLGLAQVKTICEDTQASLVAALARIEAFRIRERQLIDELSQLRAQVHGQQIEEARGLFRKSFEENSPEVDSKKAPAEQQPVDLASLGTCSITIPKPDLQQWTSVTGNAPLYVTSVEGGEHAVSLVQGGKKLNCSIIITADHIDFVELRARIHSQDFLGISSVKETKAQSRFLCCFSTPATHGDDDRAVQGPLDLANGNDGGEATGTRPEGEAGDSQQGTWQVHLRSGPNAVRSIKFEASQATRNTLHRCTEKWLGNEDPELPEKSGDSNLAMPRHLVALPEGEVLQLVGEPSAILTPTTLAALSSGLPPLERMRPWALVYSTRGHGTSLSTLFRRCGALQPTVTLIKDVGGHVFGCYTSEGWRVAPRFYGSGESFVFQLEPHLLMWPWRSQFDEKNDFFQYSTPDCLALGGTGHFAVHLDAELLQGSSGACGTFGSPSLSHKEDFKVLLVEVWQAGS